MTFVLGYLVDGSVGRLQEMHTKADSLHMKYMAN